MRFAVSTPLLISVFIRCRFHGADTSSSGLEGRILPKLGDLGNHPP